MSAAAPPQGANDCGPRTFVVGALPLGVGRHSRSQARPSGLGFALLGRASSLDSAAAAAASVGVHP
jgi:hypothetical protein